MISESGFEIPCARERPEKPGLYLELTHGRTDRGKQMNNWGRVGPLIGPLEWCHTTYATHLRILFKSVEDEQRYFAEIAFPDAHDIDIVHDLAFIDNVYYGDWSVFHIEQKDTAYPNDTFRTAKRRGSVYDSTANEVNFINATAIYSLLPKK